jgi:hypothetical protein
MNYEQNRTIETCKRDDSNGTLQMQAHTALFKVTLLSFVPVFVIPAALKNDPKSMISTFFEKFLKE